MEGKQFSTSRGYVIYIRDVLDRYGPDAIRYYICAAGPENQDANFTWAEFVQRNNSELVAGWGNLVNRTAAMIAKNFGEIPAPAALEPVDEAVRAKVLAAFDTVGGLLERQRIKAAVAEAMRTVGEVNKYVTDTEPFKLKGEDQRERLGTVLHTLAQCVSDLNTMLSPFLPHSSNAVHAAFGGEGTFMPMPVLEEVSGLDQADADRTYPVITGEYSTTPRWESRPVDVGAPVVKPTPIFTKLDESVVEQELARLRDDDEASGDGSA
jgi:methionyl-tRNA synthetase